MSALTITIVFLFIFVSLLNFLFLMKLIFEINKFKKINKFINELEIFKSPFFLNKLLEIKKFSLKNKEYLKIYNYLFYKYIDLIIKKNTLIIKRFIEALNIETKKESLNLNIIENSKIFNIYNDFEKNNELINKYSEELNITFAIENIVFERIDLLNLILDKLFEELYKLNLNFEINIDFLKIKIKLILENLRIFESEIYKLNYFEIKKRLYEMNYEVIHFSEKLIIWIKTISLFELLKEKQNELLKLIDLNKKQNYILLIQKLNREFQKTNIQIFNKICNFVPFETKDILLNLIFDLENKIYQVKNIDNLNKLFVDSFEFIIDKFNILQKEFLKFNDLIQNFEYSNFFTRFQKNEFKNFKKLLLETKKEINFLIIDKEEINLKNFLNEDLLKIENLSDNLIILFKNLPRMINFFNTEKQKNNEMFLTLLNIESLFLKPQYIYIKNIFFNRFNQIMKDFLLFKKEQLSSNDQQTNLIFKYNNILSEIRNLKKDIKESIFLKNIIDELFVRVNKFRFNNDFSRNKILNAEIMFIKNDFKNVIYKLIDIYESETLIWNN